MGRGPCTYERVVSLGALVAVVALVVTLLGVALLLALALPLLAILLLGFTPGEQLLERIRARRFQRRVACAPRDSGCPACPRRLAHDAPGRVRACDAPASAALVLVS